MRIVILSTETDHHTYFINRIASSFEVVGVFYETRHLKFPFDISSPFEKDEKDFEEHNLFIDVPDSVLENLPIHHVTSVNVLEFKEMVQGYKADLALVFGCGLIRPHVFSLFEKGLINVHRGIAEKYRGLDSDLWAIYHNDCGNIGTTLHFVEENLDTGDILGMERIKYTEHDRISHLRYKTTVLATEMMIDSISLYSKDKLIRIKQKRYGRYYSAMPSVLKPVCVNKFVRFIKSQFCTRGQKF